MVSENPYAWGFDIGSHYTGLPKSFNRVMKATLRNAQWFYVGMISRDYYMSFCSGLSDAIEERHGRQAIVILSEKMLVYSMPFIEVETIVASVARLAESYSSERLVSGISCLGYRARRERQDLAMSSSQNIDDTTKNTPM